MIQLYNFLARKKEPFKPIQKGKVGLYTCGPTVYYFAHIGNLRTFIFEDILHRLFQNVGYKIKHVMNITDVEDKTIRDSAKSGKSLKEFTSFYTKEFLIDLEKLNIEKADTYPRATDHIKEMVALINVLLKKKLAYISDDGVYFDISAFKNYGKLSRLDTRFIISGARISADEYSKDDAKDFALWKFRRPGEPFWKASFGEGRPGWHIECSAMSMKYLGNTFDIHAGAIDLLFPHHEDEIAQSEGATNKQFARYFVEGEHLLVDGKKMSKSLHNFYTLRDIEKRDFDPLDFRYLVLTAHYRKQLNFTWRSLEGARGARVGLKSLLERLTEGPYGGTLKDENEALKVISDREKKFLAAIADDLNTPRALANLIQLLHYGNALLDRKLLTRRAAKVIIATAYEFDTVLGLNLKKREQLLIPSKVLELAKRREELRKAKEWAKADKIRQEIENFGFIIEDAAGGPRVKKR